MHVRLIAVPLFLSLVSVGFPSAANGAVAFVPRFTVIGHDTTDSGFMPVPLTEDLLTRFIALKQDLQKFWPTHQALLAEAQAHAHHPVVDMSPVGVNQSVPLEIFNYVALTAHTPEVAAIFSKHHFAPAKFESVQISVLRGGIALREIQATQTPPPFETESVDSKNMMLVQSHIQQLSQLGLIPRVQ